jgi:hypothetical protein
VLQAAKLPVTKNTSLQHSRHPGLRCLHIHDALLSFVYYSVTDIDPGLYISYRLADGTLAGANEITFLMPPVFPSSTS